MIAIVRTDQADGNTTASTGVRANGVDHYRNVVHLDRALQVVLQNLLPARVLPKVKRQMRREMRKPVEMKVHAYCQYLVCLNQHDLPNLPQGQGEGRKVLQQDVHSQG